MDTLGICGAPSIAADNGAVMVKEPSSERVSENLDSPLDSRNVSEWTETDGTRRDTRGRERLRKGKLSKCVVCV